MNINEPSVKSGLSSVSLLLSESYAPMETDDFTRGLMMDCWVKIIYGQRDTLKRDGNLLGREKCDKTKNNSPFSRRRRAFSPAEETFYVYV